MYWSVSPRTKTGMLMPSSEMIVTAPSDQPWHGVRRTVRGDADPGREDHGRDGQLDGRREADEELAQDRLVVDDARPEVARKMLPDS
jgi:hypothetical protein